MEIIVLYTLLFMCFLLGGLLLQGGKICLGQWIQIIRKEIIKTTLQKGLFMWAVKFALRGFGLLNTVICSDAKNTTQTTLIQIQNIKFKG